MEYMEYMEYFIEHPVQVVFAITAGVFCLGFVVLMISLLPTIFGPPISPEAYLKQKQALEGMTVDLESGGLLAERGFCETCAKTVRAHKIKKINHWGHLFLSLLTVGLWVTPWVLIALMTKPIALCFACGDKLKPLQKNQR